MFLAGFILMIGLVALGGFTLTVLWGRRLAEATLESQDEIVRRVWRLTRQEASELTGRLVTFALWWFGLSLAVATLALALGADR
jgi:hypothetical protein